ncbi:MAG: hypothetical protein A2147_01605 [Chloroflexi bacterium RBG_16_57_8]|nr:MAG: hypothetical protein A2147_01605 [Chloroflexi bacterium RBG_16_57_8]
MVLDPSPTYLGRLQSRLGIDPGPRSDWATPLFWHGLATVASRNAPSAFYVQELFGHSAVAMTGWYAAAIDNEEVTRAHGEFSPAGRLLDLRWGCSVLLPPGFL